MNDTKESPLTSELRTRIISALRDSWNEIADDIPDSPLMSREEIAELAADAGRLTYHGLTLAENSFYFRLPEIERARIKRLAFP